MTSKAIIEKAKGQILLAVATTKGKLDVTQLLQHHGQAQVMTPDWHSPKTLFRQQASPEQANDVGYGYITGVN